MADQNTSQDTSASTIEPPPLPPPPAPAPNSPPPTLTAQPATPIAPPPPAQPALPVVGDPPPIEEEDKQAGATSTHQAVTVPHGAFKKIKDRAADAGRKALEAKYAERASKLGFKSVDEMFAALEQETTMTTPADPNAPITLVTTAAPATAPVVAPPPVIPAAATAKPVTAAQPPAGQPPAGEHPEDDRRVPENVRKRLRAAREEFRNKTAAAEAAQRASEERFAGVQREMEVLRAEQTMREDMIRGGVRDVDYAFFEMKRHLAELAKDTTPEGKEKFSKFDAKAWTAELRKTRPYLFGEQPTPANTGVVQPPPAAPSPSNVQGGAAAGGVVDARKMSPQEFSEHMRKRGINSGTSYPPRG